MTSIVLYGIILTDWKLEMGKVKEQYLDIQIRKQKCIDLVESLIETYGEDRVLKELEELDEKLLNE